MRLKGRAKCLAGKPNHSIVGEGHAGLAIYMAEKPTVQLAQRSQIGYCVETGGDEKREIDAAIADDGACKGYEKTNGEHAGDGEEDTKN